MFHSLFNYNFSCDVWLDPVFDVKYPCFPTTWIDSCVKDPGLDQAYMYSRSVIWIL